VGSSAGRQGQGSNGGATTWIGIVLGVVGLVLAFSLYRDGKTGGAVFLVVVAVAIAVVFILIGRRSRR
jgi:hypothetical protein